MDYPDYLMEQMQPDDRVIRFDEIKVKTGCLGFGILTVGKVFLALTEQRFIFKTITWNNGWLWKRNPRVLTGNVPLKKVSNILILSNTSRKGCFKKTELFLELNVQGGITDLYVGRDEKTIEEFVRSFISIENSSQ